MSLINKVLRDLEAQRDADGAPPPLASPLAHDNLRPVKPVMSRLSRQQLLRIGLALVVVAGGAFAWSQWGAKLLETGKKPPASVTAPPAPVAPAVETKTASTTAHGVAPSPPSPAPEAASPPVAEIKPAPAAKVAPPPPPAPTKPAAEPVKTETVTAVPPARIAKAAPSVIAPPAAAARTDKDTVVRKPKSEPAPAAPAKAEKPTSAPAPVKEAAAPEAVEGEPVALEADKPVAKPRDTAKPAGKTVMEKKVKPLSPEDKAESEYRLAATSLQAKRVGEGESHLRAALAAQPAHVKARELLAGLTLQGGRWRETQALLEQGLNLTPGHYPYAQLLARVYVDHGSEKKALELLEKSREAAGTDAEYFAFLATLYQRTGRHDEAVKSFTEAVKLRPQEGRWWLGAAISLEAAEQWKAAGEAYQRAAASGKLDKQLLQYSQQRLAVVKNK